MAIERVGYAVCTQAAPTLVRSGPAGFYGFTVVSSTSGGISVYDGTSASGTILFSKASLAAGDVVHFGGKSVAFGSGLYVVVTGTAVINVLHG